MTPLAVALVLAAAFLHAFWNLHAKRAGGSIAFIWLMLCGSVLLYVPVAIVTWALIHPRFVPIDWLFICGTAVLHVVYFLLLQGGYRIGDLSVVYPLSRGTGPLLTALVATAFLGERPAVLGWLGIVLVLSGIIVFAGDSRRLAGAHGTSVAYAVATGALIAAYTLWDRHAVNTLALSPIVYDFLGNTGRALLLAPLAMARRGEIVFEYREHLREIVIVAALSPLAYLMVLFAMRIAPVSYVAPAREVSIVIGALLGVRMLAEPDSRRRIVAAVAIVGGIVAIAVA